MARLDEADVRLADARRALERVEANEHPSRPKTILERLESLERNEQGFERSLHQFEAEIRTRLAKLEAAVGLEPDDR